jgi:hypothetical protein
MKNRIALRIVCGLSVFLFFAQQAVVAEPIEVLNPSFELVGGVDQTVKRTTVYPDDWTFASGGSGTLEFQASEGDVCVAVRNVDSVFQLTDRTVASGDEYTLKFDSFFLYADAAAIWNATFQGILYYDNGGARTELGHIENNLSTGMPDWAWHYGYSLTTTIPTGHAAIGNKLGIELAVTEGSPTGTTWFGFDNIRLFIPRTESATFLSETIL